MFKKTIIWGLCVVFVAILAMPASADQSIGYQEYFKEGVKAFNSHDDQKALRCFKIAQIYDPGDEQLKSYLDILEKRGVSLELHPSPFPPEKTIGYIYYFNGGIKAFQVHNDKKAILYFKIALIFNPASKAAEWYLKILYSRRGMIFPAPTEEKQTSAVTPAVSGQENISQAMPSVSAKSVGPATLAPAPVYVPAPLANAPPAVLSLEQITNNGEVTTKIKIEIHSSIILEGKNFQKFLVVNEGYIGVNILDPHHLKIDALRIGATFLHVWDDSKRHTLYIEVVFPKSVVSSAQQLLNEIQHAQPFQVVSSNDWNTYYTGKNIPGLKRQSYEFNQVVSMYGETPYGYLDASENYSDFNNLSQFDSYTVGLSQIPLEGTSNFDLRGFDALRCLSPLTMPSTNLRGAFADVDLMDGLLGISFSHGQERIPLTFITFGRSQLNNIYVDAAKITLFPTSDNDQYAFNFATAYGQDRQRYLTNHVYSVEGQHKFNDFLTLKAEEGSDTSHDSTLASLKWQDGNFKTGVHFRDIDKNYSTISTLPAYQGEVGADWTTEGIFKNFTENTFIEAYRDRLDANPDHQSRLNYDGYGQIRTDINPNLWSDTNVNFLDTAGELSPQRSFGLNERLSRSFGVWNSLKGNLFTGAGYQNSHSADSKISDFGREDVIAGVQLPLTSQISAFGNYEYDWLNQPAPAGSSNPNIINAGLEYTKQLNPKLSITSQVEYHDELGVRPSENSFLPGQRSVILSSGFAYNPIADVSIFGDGDASKVYSHTGQPSYDDFEVHLGVRITFGGAVYWDPLGTVSGIVFKDRNGDGKFAIGDEGIPDIKVKVGDKVVVTDKNGRYRIQIRAKGVLVLPVLDSIPGGLLFSTPQSLNVAIVQGRTSKADFGLVSQTGIYGIVFVDKNGTGIPSDNDIFIGKVKVILDGKDTQKSDSHGAFYFRNVVPGQHIISIDLNTLALNMVPLVKLKNKIDVAEGTNYQFNIPVQVKKAEGEQE